MSTRPQRSALALAIAALAGVVPAIHAARGQCTASSQLAPAPASLLLVLDASASMDDGGKWAALRGGVAAAIDRDAFDRIDLGALVYPAAFTSLPQCIVDGVCGGDRPLCEALLPNGSVCGAPALAQVAIADTATDKTSAPTGVRRALSDWLTGHAPLSNQVDDSPLFDALASSIAALRARGVAPAAALVVTDGGISCTELSNPSRPGYTDGTCPRWEYPASLDALAAQAATDLQSPVSTGVIGIPGSDSQGGMVGSFPSPPYSMLLALSTLAAAGAPDALDPACDAGLVFTQADPPPAHPCHTDLSAAGAFGTAALADAISDARTALLECRFERPLGGDALATGGIVRLVLDGVERIVPPVGLGGSCDPLGCYAATAQTLEIRGDACRAFGRATTAAVEIACPEPGSDAAALVASALLFGVRRRRRRQGL